MKNNLALFNKTLVVGTIILFIVICTEPSLGNILERESNNPISIGNTLYVGGSGEGNYSSIQNAINDSTDGDTVFVFRNLFLGSGISCALFRRQ